MTNEKKQLLDQTFQTFVEIGLSGENVGILDDMVAKDIVGFGTTIDEKIFGVKEMRDLLLRQKEQSAGMEMNWKINTLDIHISSDENTAIYTNEIILYVTVDGNTIEMYMRFSVVLEYIQQKWLVVHWHGSKPEHIASEKDTWGIQTWKEKAEALEKEVAERTADLVEKNRELEIETALERVRSTSLAMHSSNDLSKVVYVVFTELIKLDAQLDRCLILIVDPQTLDITWYLTGKEGLLSSNGFLVPHNTHPSHQAYLEGWRTKRKKWYYLLSGEEKLRWDAFGFAETELAQLPEFIKADMAAVKAIHLTISSDDFGCLIASSLSPLSEMHASIVERFTIVFNQTYTRFLDLQKAETQAKEAHIETALERVRSKTMAMHNSNDVGESVAALFDELTALGVLTAQDRCGIGIMQPNEMMELWTAEKATGKTELTIGYLDMKQHLLLKNVYQNWLDKKETYQYILEGEDKLKYYEAMRNQTNYKIRKDYYSSQEKIVHTDFFFNEGCLYVFSQNEFSAESASFMLRFANVFGQTYRRYLDLQKAEAQALDAIKRASVDRVRAEIASMRTTSDLERIQPLIWNELKTLGVPFIRCGVFIMNEAKQDVQAFLSTPDGKSIAAFHMPYSSSEQSKRIVAHWQQKQIFKDHMDEKAFVEYTKNLVQQGAVASDEKYVTENRPTDLYLHFLPFLQGMLYVGNNATLNNDELQLVQNLADAFSTAYARYEDFYKLDMAKTAVESAMSELKATQSQLVQQEKLASLGQLTAGIAHEIKNPLNFVNNFSEVSIELLDEVLEEIEKNKETRDEILISGILKDIRSNMQRVHDHGFRANSIVTSMLQHSRGGTGSMHPTDLNALIKEYVNLSYHGMRASKNPIDVEIALDLDPGLSLVTLIKEDFTRVVINLSNNAFDAMREKVKSMYEVRGTKYEVGNAKEEVQNTKYEVQGTKYEEGEEQKVDYKPSLSIQTRLENGKVLIQFKDNGPGIPDEIKDKILHPFFTTKKGTEGTGLGLSITNDIVKAHGGEMKVETIVGEGTSFIIQLPMAN